MKTGNKFWWFAAIAVFVTFAILSGLGLFLWHQLAPDDRLVIVKLLQSHFGYVFGALVLLLAAIGFAIDGIFHVYILPLSKLVEETTVIYTANPSHRIALEGSRDIVNMADLINREADRFEQLQRNIREQSQLARAEIELEKNILAAILAELPDAVVICDMDGRVILYNRRAGEMLVGRRQKSKSGGFIGLGRSIFNLVDKNLIVHALDEIDAQIKADAPTTASSFVTGGAGDTLLRTEAVPVLNQHKHLTGFVLLMRDITQAVANTTAQHVNIRSGMQQIRGSLASIRSAIEAILEFPEMNAEQLGRFRSIIHKEAIDLSRVLDGQHNAYADRLPTHWPLTPMLAKDLLQAVIHKAQQQCRVPFELETIDETCWIKVDSYSTILAMLFAIDQIITIAAIDRFFCSLDTGGEFVQFNFMWIGKPVKIEQLRKLDDQLVAIGEEALPLTVKEVRAYNQAQIWTSSTLATAAGTRCCLRIFFPGRQAEDVTSPRTAPILPHSRPEFYDFDLFNQPGQKPEVDGLRLTEAHYTVFDTETTGLDPKAGDEIISVGAVRIVNGRLLRDERFDQIVDPRRQIPAASTKVHGLNADMVAGQPAIGQVLPRFHKFCSDTVLVAHNAAFDMRMLQLKEQKTGVRFVNPVLDTMLLSEVVHPAHKNHSIEAIAHRLGVSVIGRHTALGDAIVTGEIFLKLIPLLIKQGICCIGDARAASQKTYNARLKY